MKKPTLVALIVGLAFPLAASAETWKNAPMVDTNCVSRVKQPSGKMWWTAASSMG